MSKRPRQAADEATAYLDSVVKKAIERASELVKEGEGDLVRRHIGRWMHFEGEKLMTGAK